jgi:hypothetical protein
MYKHCRLYKRHNEMKTWSDVSFVVPKKMLPNNKLVFFIFTISIVTTVTESNKILKSLTYKDFISYYFIYF